MSSDKNSIDRNPNSAVIPGRKKSLTMRELKKQLADLGLQTTGKKTILLNRLKEHYNRENNAVEIKPEFKQEALDTSQYSFGFEDTASMNQEIKREMNKE